MTKISIHKSTSNIDKKYTFIVSGSYKYMEEDNTLNIDDPEMSDYDMSENLSSSIWNYLEKREVNINTDYAITGWMLCAVTHICNDVIDNSDSNNKKHINNVIKTLFYGWSDDELHVSHLFESEYTEF